MANDHEMIDRTEAEAEVGKAVRRLALLHLAFAETAIAELGEEKGRELVVKAIRSYGLKIGGTTRRQAEEAGLPPTPETFEKVPGEAYPSIGAHDKVEIEQRDGRMVIHAHGCLLAKVWKEYGGEELGRLYCLTDPAQFMAFEPGTALVHLKAEPDGDDHCELVFRETTEQEREDFAANRDWSYMDFNQK
jgi:hypothetical protein